MQISLRRACSLAIGLAIVVLPGAAVALLILYALSRRGAPRPLKRLFEVLADDTAAAIQALKSMIARNVGWTLPAQGARVGDFRS